jgi:hypothetical protein
MQPYAEASNGPEAAVVEREDCLEGQPAYPCPTATLPPNGDRWLLLHVVSCTQSFILHRLKFLGPQV